MFRHLIPAAATIALAPAFSAQAAPLYKELTAQLDSEPQFQVVWDFEGMPNLLAQKATEYLLLASQSMPEKQIPPIDITPIADSLGLLAVDGIAMSSKKVDTRYHNVMFYSMPEGPKGLLALGGHENRAFTVGDFAPADASFAFEGYFDSDSLVATATAVAGAVMGPMGSGMVQGQLAQPIDAEGTTIAQLISQLNTPVLGYMQLDMGHSPVPKFDFAGKLSKSGALLASVRPMLESSGFAFSEGADGSLVGTIVIPMNGEMAPLQIVLISRGDALYITSSQEYFDATQSGARLSSNAMFKKAVGELPKQGNSLSYVSPDYYQSYKNFFATMGEGEANSAELAVVQKVLNDYFGRFTSPQVSVGYYTDGGWKQEGYAEMSLGEAFITVPVALAAGFAVPALQAAQKHAESMSEHEDSYDEEWSDEDSEYSEDGGEETE